MLQSENLIAFGFWASIIFLDQPPLFFLLLLRVLAFSLRCCPCVVADFSIFFGECARFLRFVAFAVRSLSFVNFDLSTERHSNEISQLHSKQANTHAHTQQTNTHTHTQQTHSVTHYGSKHKKGSWNTAKFSVNG